MKIAICADLHFRGKNLQDKIKAWESAVDKMIEAKVDVIVLAGDIFDTRQIGGREASTGTVYRAFMEGINRLKEDREESGQFADIVAVQGNHELATGDQLSALEPLKDAGVQVKDEFGLVDDFADVTIAYIPWVADTGSRAEELKRWLLCIKKAFELKPNKFKLVVGHLTVRGAQLNSGIQIVGSEFEVDPAQLMGLRADLIVLGHIHKRQWFGDKSGDKVCYVGALSQGDFGEEGNPQGFMIVDTCQRMHEFVDIQAPEYILCDFTTDDIKNFEKEEERSPVKELDEHMIKLETDRGSYMKFRLNKKPDNMDDLLKIPNLTIEIVPDRIAPVRLVEGVEAGRSDLDMLDSYLVSRGLLDADRARIRERARVLSEAIK